MDMLVVTAGKDRKIIFDDYCRGDSGSVWAEMCPRCHNRYKNMLRGHFDDGGTAQGTCSIAGCGNPARYYVDFAQAEYTIENIGPENTADALS